MRKCTAPPGDHLSSTCDSARSTPSPGVRDNLAASPNLQSRWRRSPGYAGTRDCRRRLHSIVGQFSATTIGRAADRGAGLLPESAPSGRRARQESTDRRSRGALSAQQEMLREASKERGTLATYREPSEPCCRRVAAATQLPACLGGQDT